MSKIGRNFRKQSCSKIEFRKHDFTKKKSPELKNSIDFLHRKLTLKVHFWHFLRPSGYVNLQNIAILFEYS